ncbi:MAG: NAD(P)-dependent oxidoreductase [Chlamydiota bacterium]
MKILLTGGSSFSGMWFAKELASAGHDVVAPLLKKKNAYQGLRKERVSIFESCADVRENISFGSEAFFDLVNSEEHWDVFCHHAADVTDYKNPSFDYIKATKSNTLSLPSVLESLKKKNCQKVILTGSVFEQGEGRGSDNLRAVSPYGLSKGLTADIFNYWCSLFEMKLGKFVIPNPFGPYEEKRFTAFLMSKWLSGETAIISHPDYIRDNIHVTLLSKAYARFVTKSVSEPGFEKINPSQYIGPQKHFTEIFAENMRKRLSLPCEFQIMEQNDFSEPIERVNTETLDANAYEWNEEKAWDEIADYYSNFFTG